MHQLYYAFVFEIILLCMKQVKSKVEKTIKPYGVVYIAHSKFLLHTSRSERGINSIVTTICNHSQAVELPLHGLNCLEYHVFGEKAPKIADAIAFSKKLN